jgi:hypothetical protein
MGDAGNTTWWGKLIQVLGLNLTTGFRRVEWRDEYVAEEWLEPQQAGQRPSVATVEIVPDVLVRMRSYSHTAEQWLTGEFEINHDVPTNLLNDGTLQLDLHVHARPSDNSAGVVQWAFDIAHSPANDGAPVPLTRVLCPMTFAANTINHHYVTGCHIVLNGDVHIGDIFSVNVRRLASEGADTYEAGALFIKAAMHVPTDGRGSRQTFVK